MKRLYIDLDGVMADFDAHFEALFGEKTQDVPDALMWKYIDDHGTFFRDLPVCPGAKEMFDSVVHLDPLILTACPKTNYAAAAKQKRQWVYAHLSTNVTVLPVMGGKNKPLFMHSPGDVLVDDFGHNCVAWDDHGGVSIHHKTFGETMKQLSEMFNLKKDI